MRKKIPFILLIVLGIVLFPLKWTAAEEDGVERVLPLEEFITLAVRQDTEFERILIDGLLLQYEKALQLPAGDLILDVKAQHDLMLSQKREESEGTVSLSKLFPFTGTSLTAEYVTTASYTSTENTTGVTFEIAQPIAQNAFGKATRLKDRIVGLEIDVARHQIIEAYEDYLAVVIIGYYDWHEAYENLKVGESSYGQNIKLLDNMKERQKSNIALPIDVNKVHLLVLAKKEKLIQLKEAYNTALNFIEKALRHDGSTVLVPVEPGLFKELAVSFERDFAEFKQASRTYQILDLLEKKSRLKVDKEADDLLPSIDLLFGYNVRGRRFQIREEENMVYTGISFGWPIGNQVDKAEYEASKILMEKTQLSNVGTHFRLYTDIRNLAVRMASEQELLDIATEKIGLAKFILDGETDNYSFGRVSLNDYIAAVNVLDNNRFNQIFHDAQYKKLLIEWLRITDRLVSKSDIPNLK